ncbi:hypothetical protein [Ferrimonas gelatinilytica]|uniref:Cytochrome c n=1 Tax=Ferrimonas gelatinilytica TaxID=1255257 RepID=A0ABP9RZ95_9GAMM
MLATTERKLFLGIALLGAVAAVLGPRPTLDSSGPMEVSQLRSALTQRGQADVIGLAYYGTDHTPAPYGPGWEEDINLLLQDFPTAAGGIRERVLKEDQYRAAMNGDYDEAMRLMAKSFKEGQGSGSYATRW